MTASRTNGKTGFDAAAVVLCGLAAIVLVLALALFIEGGYDAARNRQEQVKIYDAEISEEARTARAEQQALLDEPVQYLDQEAGVLCMPIEAAMKRVVAANAE